MFVANYINLQSIIIMLKCSMYAAYQYIQCPLCFRFVDATFKLVKEPFYQLFSVHAFVESGSSTKRVAPCAARAICIYV